MSIKNKGFSMAAVRTGKPSAVQPRAQMHRDIFRFITLSEDLIKERRFLAALRLIQKAAAIQKAVAEGSLVGPAADAKWMVASAIDKAWATAALSGLIIRSSGCFSLVSRTEPGGHPNTWLTGDPLVAPSSSGEEELEHRAEVLESESLVVAAAYRDLYGASEHVSSDETGLSGAKQYVLVVLAVCSGLLSWEETYRCFPHLHADPFFINAEQPTTPRAIDACDSEIAAALEKFARPSWPWIPF